LRVDLHGAQQDAIGDRLVLAYSVEKLGELPSLGVV